MQLVQNNEYLIDIVVIDGLLLLVPEHQKPQSWAYTPMHCQLFRG